MKSVIGYNNVKHLNRHDGTVLKRLRIGHARATHLCFLCKESPPECDFYLCRLTVHHMLLECALFNAVRQQYFSATSLAELFQTATDRLILDFIKAIGFWIREGSLMATTVVLLAVTVFEKCIRLS